MPCFLVVSIQLLDYLAVKKAADELGLVEGKDYSWNNGRVVLLSSKARSNENALKQRYGVVQSESLARRKGYKAQRKVEQDGSIQLRLTR